ncbi:MAG: hypothetical protein Q4C65_13270 [Eubacteriales bacterium]|nr:hypothetical protein [Eubacteriales bacterium]
MGRERLAAFGRRRENFILALGMTAALFLFLTLRYDFYYDLNDDVLIKDILSGVYTGTPEGRTMQLLYPLGALLALLYRGLAVPVFGGFLLLCQFGSVLAVGWRSLSLCRRRSAKLFLLAAQGLLWLTVFGSHLVYLQYTVTAGMLASAALFWVLTAKSRRWAALVLYWLAFSLRPEIALLLLPLAAVAGLCAWARDGREEGSFFARRLLHRYLGLFLALALGMGLLYGADAVAYQSGGWPAFRQFFDARTRLYDYHLDFAEQYEENRASYEKLGISEAEQRLLANYNFGVDDGIDAERMTALAREAERQSPALLSGESVRTALWRLLHENWLGRGDFPFNLLWIGTGLGLVLLCLRRGRRRFLWQPVLAVLTGAGLWLYLLLEGRMVARVTHPLYLAQLLLFWGLWLGEALPGGVSRQRCEAPQLAGAALQRIGAASQRAGVKKSGLWLSGGLLFAVSCIGLTALPGALGRIGAERSRREQVNRTNEAVMDYCSAHPGTLFLEDVYSTVDFSEKITVDKEKPFNYDLLGGWLVKSPLTKKKLAAFGYDSMGGAVRDGKNVQLVCGAGTDLSWLTEYLAQEGTEASLVRVAILEEGAEIYQLWTYGGEEIGTGEDGPAA